MNKAVRFGLALLAAFACAECADRAFWGARARAAEKTGVFELYAVGDSTTLGVPYPETLAFAALAARMLGGQVAGRPIALRMIARQGDSAYPQALRLRRALMYRDRSNPAAVLIYSGHNERLSAPPRFTAFFRAWNLFKRRMIFRSMLASDLLLIFEKASGLRGVRDLDGYEFYLQSMAAASVEAGAAPIFSTLIANVAGIEPQLPRSAASRHDEIAALVGRGLALEERSLYGEAIAYYAELIKSEPELEALLRFRIGRCLEARRDDKGAKRIYWEAVDADPQTAYGRATTRHNEIVRKTAENCQSPWIDAVRLFEENSPRGLVGDELFADGYHPNMRGQAILARAFAEQISARFNSPLVKTDFSEDDLELLAAYPPERRADPDLYSGMWRVLYYFDHPSARHSMDFAETRLRRGLDAAPDQYWARVALGLAEASKRNLRRNEKDDVRWILDLLWYPERSPSAEQARRIAAALEHLGASPGTVARLKNRVKERR